jgi:hypothetical protein
VASRPVPADSLAAMNASGCGPFRRTFDQLVGKSLVIPLAMIVRDELEQ